MLPPYSKGRITHAWMLPRGIESKRSPRRNWIAGHTRKYPAMTDRQRLTAMKRTRNRRADAWVKKIRPIFMGED